MKYSASRAVTVQSDQRVDGGGAGVLHRADHGRAAAHQSARTLLP